MKVLIIYYTQSGNTQAIAKCIARGAASTGAEVKMVRLKNAGYEMMEDYDLIGHPRTYRYFDKPVLYPFGYGLSYTAFGYSGLRAEREGENLKVSVQITNTGRVPGDEVAQLYIRRLSPSGTVHPIRRLIGFERLHDLQPGESRRAEFEVHPCDLEIYMEKEGKKVVEPGTYEIYAGGSCLDERVRARIEL